MNAHCMHPPLGSRAEETAKTRTCCWCGMEQKRVYVGSGLHGPHIEKQYQNHQWEPLSLEDCTERNSQ